jgi:hypothetical protein
MDHKFAKHRPQFSATLNGQRVQHGIRSEAEEGRLKLGQAAVTKASAQHDAGSGVEP